jgi:hypothetical protein
VDLLVADALGALYVLMSTGCTRANWIEVEAPPGATVRVDAGDRAWTTLATAEPGMGASAPAVAHVGLGEATEVTRIVLTIPWVGTRTLVGPVPARQRVRWVGDGG